MKLANLSRCIAVVTALTLGGVIGASSGCNQKETMLDVETPGGEVEIKRDKTDGEIEVDVNDK